MAKTKDLERKIIEFLTSGEKTQAEISRYLNLSRSRTSELLSDLESRGIINKRKISERTIEISINRDQNIILGILPSAEYVFLIQAFEELQIRYIPRIFSNSLEGFKELILGHIDMLASPLVSGYIFHLIDVRIKPIMGIAKGGGGLVKRKDSGILGSTPFSKMDRISRSEKNFEIMYFRSIEELIEAFHSRNVDAISIWEPFLTMEGGSVINKGETCCALFENSSKSWDEALVHKYSEIVGNKSFPRKGIEIISDLLHVDEDIIEKSLSSYDFTPSINKDDLETQLSAMGIGIIRDLGEFLGR